MFVQTWLPIGNGKEGGKKTKSCFCQRISKLTEYSRKIQAELEHNPCPIVAPSTLEIN